MPAWMARSVSGSPLAALRKPLTICPSSLSLMTLASSSARLLSTQLISTALLKALRVSLLLSACCRSSCMLRHYAGGLTRKPSKLHGVSKHDNERYTGLLRLSQVCKMMCEHCNAEMSH